MKDNATKKSDDVFFKSLSGKKLQAGDTCPLCHDTLLMREKAEDKITGKMHPVLWCPACEEIVAWTLGPVQVVSRSVIDQSVIVYGQSHPQTEADYYGWPDR